MDDKIPSHTAKDLLRYVHEREKLSRRHGAFQDLRQTLTRARPYRLWMTALTYLRRIRMISILLRIITWIFTLLQTGTLVLLTTAFLFIFIPVLLLVLPCGAILALADRRRSLRILQKELKNKRVYVFFCIHGGFGAQNARSFSTNPNTAVLVVSPYWISPQGFGRHRFFINLRQEKEGLFLIRRFFYFSVRKRLENARLAVIF